MRGADVAERQVDLVVHDEHPLERQLVGAARRADRAAGVVHVRLRQQHRDARAAGAGAALGQQAGELRLRARQVPARGEPVGDLEADVVRRAGVLRAGVAEADDEPVDRCAASPARPGSRMARRLRSRSAASPVPASPAGASPTSSVSSSISSSSVAMRGGVSVATVVSSGSSSSVTPSGTATSASVIVSLMSMRRHVVEDRLGDRVRQRLDVQLARDLLEHAALLDAGRLLAAGQLERHDRVDRDVEVDAQQVDVHRLAAHRVVLGALEDRGGGVRRRRRPRARRRRRRARGAARGRRR